MKVRLYRKFWLCLILNIICLVLFFSAFSNSKVYAEESSRKHYLVDYELLDFNASSSHAKDIRNSLFDDILIEDRGSEFIFYSKIKKPNTIRIDNITLKIQGEKEIGLNKDFVNKKDWLFYVRVPKKYKDYYEYYITMYIVPMSSTKTTRIKFINKKDITVEQMNDWQKSTLSFYKGENSINSSTEGLLTENDKKELQKNVHIKFIGITVGGFVIIAGVFSTFYIIKKAKAKKRKK